MDPSISILFNVAKFVYSTLKLDPLHKVARAHLVVALELCQNIDKEANANNAMNRALVHLESAYGIYLQNIGTLSPLNRKSIIWEQAKPLNQVCVLIAIIHKALGNQNLAEHWLINKMSPKGPWRIETAACINCSAIGITIKGEYDRDFYQNLLKDKFKFFEEKIIIPSYDNEPLESYCWEGDGLSPFYIL